MRSRETSARRGFTLVELLVAITVGAMVAAAAVLLSRNAVRLFQEEARISYAQIAVTMGLGRIGLDLEQAGRNMTKNPFVDRRICAKSTGANSSGLEDWPTGMRRLAPVVIEKLPDLPQNAGNDLRNERITIAGDLDSGDNFEVTTLTSGVSGTIIKLLPRSRSIRRLSAMVQSGDVTTRLKEIFRVGRFLHIEGPTHDYYGLIKGFEWTGNATDDITVLLEGVPFIPTKSNSDRTCAVVGFGTGWTVHALTRVRYEIRSLVENNQFTDYMQPKNLVAGDDIRTELVRVELAYDDTEITNTLELVTEYAVALRFGITTLAPSSTPNNPVLQRLPILDPVPNEEMYAIAGPPDAQSARPENVRGVQVRLSTRSRAPDRPTPIPGQLGRPYRFFVSTAKIADKYARMRNSEREFTLMNMKGGGL